jgi:hypothetical protein
MANPNPTARDYTNLAMMLPEKEAASMRANWDTLSKDRQQQDLQSAGQVMAAFQSGSPEIGLKLLRDRAEAAKNSGDVQQAQALETWAKMAEIKPDAVTKSIGLMVAQLPGGDKIIESLGKIGSETRAQELQPAALLKASNDALKMESEAKIKQAEANLAPKKLAADLGFVLAQTDQSRAAASSSRAAAAASGATAERARAESRQINAGIIPADKRPEAESKFRKEYSDQTKIYQDVKASYGRVNASESSAVGDLSLIFGYMKMLDPGSVVREGEFATAQNAAGIDDRTVNLYNRIINGERLSESQRKAFKGQARKLYEKAAEQEKSVRSGIERIAKGYGLNPENIFYETTPKDEAAQPADQPAQSIDALLKKYGGK